MEIEFTYRIEDFREMEKAVRHGTSRRVIRPVFMWLFAATVLSLVVYFILSSPSRDRPISQLPVTKQSWWGGHAEVVIIVALIGGLIYGFVQVRARVKKQMRQDLDLQHPRKMAVGDNGIVVTSARERIEWQWNAFSEVIETKNLLLLRRTEAQFLVIPKRAATVPGQLDQLKATLRTHIVHAV